MADGFIIAKKHCLWYTGGMWPRASAKVCSSLCVLLAGVLCACSHPSSSAADTAGVTLLSLSQARLAATDWTAELEPDALAAPQRGNDGIDRAITVTPKNVFAGGLNANAKPVMPSLKGFTSLDTTALDGGALRVLESFCTAMQSPTHQGRLAAGTLMQSGSAYSLVVFLYGFEPLLTDGAAVTGWYLGMPFVTEQGAQCPVRLVLSDGAAAVDAYVWLSYTGGAWMISHITRTEA